MIATRLSSQRGKADFGWLHARHTFSFGRYYDPAHMGFRSLRVINDDIVEPGGGFGTHPHDNMEIVTWVIDGELAHADSTGSKAVLRPGMAQAMSAGSGIEHSEVNNSRTNRVRLIQTWLLPAAQDTAPRHGEKDFADRLAGGGLVTIASPDGRDGSLVIGQDATISVARLKAGSEARHALAAGRGAWIQVARGAVSVNGTPLSEGDGAAVEDEAALAIKATTDAEVLLFDLA